MKKIALTTLSISLLLLCLSAYSFFSFIHQKETARIHKTISEFQKKNILSGVVLVAKNDNMIYLKPFGFAHNETHSLNTNSTQFLLASITKTFTATAILLLTQKGLIDLNQPVSTYLKPNHSVWQGTMPDSMNKITIHHLLTHSSGLADYEKIPGHTEWYKKLHTPEQVIQFFAQEPLSFTPGSRYDYQGSNYLLLGLIIEAVTGKSYAEFLKEILCKPAHLSHTFAQTNAFLSTIQKNHPGLSIGYKLDEQTKQLKQANMVNMSVDYAESSIISNAFDLYTFINKLFSNKNITNELIQKMITPYLTTPYGTQVGYGIYLDKSLGYPLFTHGGRIEGFESIFMYEPQKKISVIILSNEMGSNIYPLGYELMDIAHSN